MIDTERALRAERIAQYVFENGDYTERGQFSVAIDSTQLGELIRCWRDAPAPGEAASDDREAYAAERAQQEGK